MHRPIRTLLAALAVVGLAACGSGSAAGEDPGNSAPDGGSDGGTVTIVAKEFVFEPSDFSLPADTSVEVVLENAGVIEHDITVDELGLKIHAVGATTTRETVTVAEGSYTFYCSVPGHRESGMEGTLTVDG